MSELTADQRRLMNDLLIHARQISRRDVTAATQALRAVYDQSAELGSLEAEFDPFHPASHAANLRNQNASVRELVSAIGGLQGRLHEQDHLIQGSLGSIRDICTLMEEISGASVVLSLNAWIETARLGASGKTIGVIAAELKAQSDKTLQATQRLITLANELTALFADVLNRSKEVTDIASTNGNEVLATAHRLETSLNGIRMRLQESVRGDTTDQKSLRAAAAGALTSLQFQDRMEQLLQRAQDLLELEPPTPRASPDSVGTALAKLPAASAHESQPGEIEFL